MKYYLNAIGLFIFLAASLGVGIPTLVSAKDSILVLLGFLWLFAIPCVVWPWVRVAFINPMKKAKLKRGE